MPQRGEGQLDEIIAGTGAFQQRPEQHEQEDHRGRNTERHPEDALCLHPEMPAGLVQRRPFPAHRVGKDIKMAEHHIDDENRRDDQQWQAKRPVHRHHHAQHAGNGEEQIISVRQAGPVGDIKLENEQIETGRNADDGKSPSDDPVQQRVHGPGGRIER